MKTGKAAGGDERPRAHKTGKLLPRLRRGGVLLGAALVAWAAWGLPGAAADEVGGVLGDWYVLVHYAPVPSSPPDPDGSPPVMAWDDAVWRIHAQGPGLRWTVFPHPEFRDGSGRRLRLEGGEEARSPGAWVPNAGQLEEISKGLAHAAHEARSKRLRAGLGGGWASAAALRSASVSQVVYHEAWKIRFAAPGPIFSQAAAMGSGRTGRLDGVTRFETDRVGTGVLTGRYSRDGEFEGSFRMLRMARAGDGAP